MFEVYRNWSVKIQNYLASGLLILLTFVVFLQVIARKLIPFPIPWTEEIAKLSLIWITYIGLAATFQQNFHIRIDLIDNLLKTDFSRNLLDLFVQFLGIIFGGFVIYYSYVYLSEQMEFGQHTSILQLPMWLVLTPLLLGGILTFIHFVMMFLTKLAEMRNKP